MTNGKKYTPEEIFAFSDIVKLHIDAEKLIKELASQVGASDYVRTPQFQKTSSGKGRRKGRGVTDIPEGWGETRKPRVAKKEGVEGIINSIRVHLNKITNKTFDTQTEAVHNQVNSLGDEMAHALPLIAESIFTIASGNAFYSSLYADLYCDLSSRHTVLISTLDNILANIDTMLKSIEWCDPNDDYDRFCEINKNNDKRRALVIFCVNLMKRGLIPLKRIEDMIIDLETRFFDSLDKEGSISINEELSELMAALIIKSSDPSHLSDSNDKKKWLQTWCAKPCIEEYATRVSKLKAKDHVGLSNKAVFKHMDMRDALAKLNCETN